MKPVSFPIPEGYQTPEGVQDGQTFDESLTLKVSGGKLTVLAVNGVSLDKKKEEEGETAQPSDANLASRYAAAAQAQP